MVISSVIEKLKFKKDLDKDDLLLVVCEFEKKALTKEEIKELVILWREKGETATELKSLADLLYEKCPQINLSFTSYPTPPIPIIDICGTGGDKSNTFNISTIAAIVTSACNVKVIKHSGRSTTSVLGSTDILEQLGFDIDNPKEIKENCFKETGLMVTSSKILRDVFGDVKKICKEINIPGFVNLIGPLTNPYKNSCHLLGVSKIEWGELLANAIRLQDLNKEALIVCSEVSKKNILDELSFCGENHLWHLVNGVIKKEVITSSGFNEKPVNLNELVIKDKSESQNVFESILKGNLNINDPKVKTVALNSGAALYLAKKVKSIDLGYHFALQHIQTGKAWEHLKVFLNCNKQAAYNR